MVLDIYKKDKNTCILDEKQSREVRKQPPVRMYIIANQQSVLTCLVGMSGMPKIAHSLRDQLSYSASHHLFDFLKCASETKIEIAHTPVTLPFSDHRTETLRVCLQRVNKQKKQVSGSVLDPRTRSTSSIAGPGEVEER